MRLYTLQSARILRLSEDPREFTRNCGKQIREYENIMFVQLLSYHPSHGGQVKPSTQVQFDVTQNGSFPMASEPDRYNDPKNLHKQDYTIIWLAATSSTLAAILPSQVSICNLCVKFREASRLPTTAL